MQKIEPEITVLMPAYNAGKYIAEAITSVLQQTFVHFELLIINDGSTDDTLAIVNSFTDGRIRTVNRNNGGVSSALNTGLQHAYAPYIARFDADDICHPQRLEIQYAFMRANPSYHIVGSAANYLDKNGDYVFNYQPPAHSNEKLQQIDYRLCPFIHSSVLYKKEVIIKAGGYDNDALGFEDHLLWRNVLNKGQAFNFSKSLISVRLNPESVTIDEKWCSPDFIKTKYDVLQKRCITKTDAAILKQSVCWQNKPKVKASAYYALLAKKFLWNNHDPAKARESLRQVLVLNRLDWNSYILFILSFLPGYILLKIYNMIKPC